MAKLKGFKVDILRHSNDMDRLNISAEGALKLKNITHRGHKYHFDPEQSFVVHEPFSLRYWLTPDILRRYERLMLFREPVDPLHGVEVPIEPLSVPEASALIEENPAVLKGVTRSQVLQRYRAKQRFGRFGMPKWYVVIIIGVFVIVALLIFTKKIPIPGFG